MLYVLSPFAILLYLHQVGYIAFRSACRFRYLLLKIQSLWRGRVQRQKTSQKVRRARLRIAEASLRWAPELTIGYRLKGALDVLLRLLALYVIAVYLTFTLFQWKQTF
jgi:hypothetical protein